MPVSLDDMMKDVPPDDRVAIERNASILAADYRRRTGGSGSEPGNYPPSMEADVGMKAVTGQRCPRSGIWRVENTNSATVPIAMHNVMPPYGNRAVTWVLVQHT